MPVARMTSFVALIALLAVVGCDKKDPLVPGPGAAASLIVVPESIAIDLNATSQFRAYGRTAAGDSLATVVNWSATNGTITPQGLFTPDASDLDGIVTATATASPQLSSSALVRKRKPVATVTVAPATASVVAGATVQLVATTRDANGNILSGRTVTWSSGSTAVGTVSASGLVTGVSAGSANITATSEGKSGTAVVTVTAPPPPPPPANPSAVTNLAVSGLTENSAVLSFTEVDNGAGEASSYDVRFAVQPLNWGSASTVSAGTCASPVQGTGIGALRTCTVLGLSAGTTYQFQLVAFRGTLNVDAVFGTLSNVATGVTLAPPPMPVASVSVSPSTASIAVIATVQLAATLRDTNGNVLSGRTVTWSSGTPAVATVSNSGLVTGVSAGSANITATSEGKSDTAVVTVTAPPPPPPPPPPAPVVLFEEKFEDTAYANRGWYDLPGGMSSGLTTAEHIAGSTRSLVVHFGPGSTSPGVGGRVLFTETDAVYLRYWIKYSSNWAGSGRAYNPHEFHFMTNEETAWVGPSRTHLTLYVEHIYQNGGRPQLAAQDGANIDPTRIGIDLTNLTEQRAVGGCNGNPDNTPQDCYPLNGLYYNGKHWLAAQPVITPGVWHKVEAYFRLNSISGGKGQLDGVAQYWLDGQLIIDRQNVILRTGAHPDMKLRQFLLAPYIGDGSPVDQTAWVDDLVIMNARP